MYERCRRRRRHLNRDRFSQSSFLTTTTTTTTTILFISTTLLRPLIKPPPSHAAPSNPRLQIPTLADIGPLEGGAAIEDGLDAGRGDADAAADAQAAQVVEVQRDAGQAVVADGAAAEGHLQLLEAREAEGDDLGGRVGEGAAEGQVEVGEGLGGVDERHDGAVRQVGAVGEAQAREVVEAEGRPGLEPRVRDGGAAREAERLESVGGVGREVRHRAVRDVLAVGEVEALELRAPDHRSGGRERHGLGLGFLAPEARRRARDDDLLGARRVGVLGDDPADDAREQVVADLAAVAPVDLLEALGVVAHLEDLVGRDVPNRLHLPDLDVLAAHLPQRREALVRDVETVA